MKIVEHPPDLRKLDGFGGAPPHSIRFPWYGDCKTDPAEPRAAGHPISLLWLLVVVRRLLGLQYQIPSFSEAAVAAPKFQGWIQRFKNLAERHYIVNVTGDCNPAKLRTHFGGLEGLLKKGAGGAEISSVCRQIVLEAGRHGKTIGKDLIAVEMDRTGHTHSSHYSEDERGSDTRS